MAKYREHLTPAMMQLLQYETEATAIRFFHTTLIPGVMQTPAYAESVLEYWDEDLSEEQRAVRAEIRSRRRDQMLNMHDPPYWYVVLDESVLRRAPGREEENEEVLADQLQHLLELAKRPHVSVRVIEFSKATPFVILGVFYIFDLGEEENAILYKESGILDEIIHARDRIERHRRRFEQMWDLALSEDASARLIEAKAVTLRSDLARRR